MAKTKELSIDIRKKVVELHEKGCGYKKISKNLCINKNTVASIVQKYKKTKTVKNISGRGRKKKTSARVDVMIVREVKKNRRVSAPKIAAEINTSYGIEISSQTIRRRIKSTGLKGKTALKKPFISNKNQKMRLQWAQEKASWTLEQWKQIIWSDETKINLFGSDGVIRVWRKPGERYKAECLRPTVKHGGGKLLMWGCMSWNRVGKLSFIDGIMNKEIYTNILRANLAHSADMMSLTDSYTFQHDGDPKHTAKSVAQWLRENHVRVLDWPAQSPDLNPIEHLWAHLKKEVAKQKPTSISNLKEIVDSEWNKIPPEFTKRLVESMPRRCQAVIEAKGGHTRY